MKWSDCIFIGVLILFILLSVRLLKRIKDEEKEMDTIKKAKLDMDILEQITKNIEDNYRPVNIKLTSYEQEQEDHAIISYEELVNNSKTSVRYDESYEIEDEINVKKVNLSDQLSNTMRQPKLEVTLMSYEKEEAFLKALRQLQSDLLR